MVKEIIIKFIEWLRGIFPLEAINYDMSIECENDSKEEDVLIATPFVDASDSDCAYRSKMKNAD